MRYFGKYGLEIKDHELVKKTNLNTFLPAYNKRQLLSSTQHNDLHKAAITSYSLSKNEKQYGRISKNNLLIARIFGIGKVDLTKLVNIIKFVYCFINPILFDYNNNSIQFIDSKFNQTNVYEPSRSCNVKHNLDNCISRITLIGNSDHFILGITKHFKIGGKFSLCNIILSSSYVSNYIYNICDIFCTKIIEYVEFNIGIDKTFPNHNQYFNKERTKYIILYDKVLKSYKSKCFGFNETVYFKNDNHYNNNNNTNNIKLTKCNGNKLAKRIYNKISTPTNIEQYRKKFNSEYCKSNECKTCYDKRQPQIDKIISSNQKCSTYNGNGSLSTRCYDLTKSNLNNLLKQNICVLLFVLITCVPIISASLHNIKYSTNIVKTKYGPLRGIVFRSNPTVEAYLGVPYATPPVGSLRFMPPVTPSTWRNTRLADRFSPVCPQAPPVPPVGPEALLEIPRGRLAQLRRLLPLLANQSEDCLYLNLYVPRKEESETGNSNAMATIVYVHGESYEWNSGNPYDGSILSAHGNVIVVTINFRLGVLGFLKTGAKGSAQGNFGLMDLVAGLHWLRENLPAFNGDSNKVTLMGHGTGASLANILVVSPVASDLISRAILISGSALSPWAIQKDPLYVKRKVAERTGCHGDLLEDDLAPCLRTRPISELLSVTIDSPRFLPGFAPFVDGTVITNPLTSISSPLTLPAGSAIASTTGIELADFPSKELLFGLTTTESYLDLSAQDLEFGFNETRRDRILRTYVRNVYHYHLNEIYSALKNEYTDWERPPRNPMGSRDASLEFLSDGHTAAPLVRLGYLHSLRGGRSYFLHFRHQSGERDYPQRTGSVRGEDVPFCLGLPISPLFPHNYTKQDIKISTVLVQYIANFAQAGNPNQVSTSHSFTNNHVATSNRENHSKLLATNVGNNNNQKEKRQTNFKRHKRNYVHDESDISESEEIEENDEKFDESNENRNNRDRLDDTTKLHVPFWDTYDSINQLYLEMGNKMEIRNHYRGHKLSMWLSLIPQLHSPGDLSELSMRHHHFLEESAQFYDGIVRPQTMHRPLLPKTVTVTSTTTTNLPKADLISVTAIPLTTTECPPNTTIVPTLAATRPQQNQAINSITNNSNLLRRLANSHYQSYTTALTVTIVVGCFLLLLNILIFAGIYYQREKRANDAKKKEELTETETNCSPTNHDKCGGKNSRKSSLQSVSGFNAGSNFGEYSCYDEKLQCKKKHALADICSVELPMQEFKCNNTTTSESNTNSLRRSVNNDHFKQNINNLMVYPPTYSSPNNQSSEAGSSTSTDLANYHQCNKPAPAEQCNQSTQSDIPDVQDVGTVVMENDVDNCISDMDNGEVSPGIPNPPPPPRSQVPYQPGILRQQGGPTTPAASKKRVQIQEISV